MYLKVNQQEGVWKNESNYKIKEVKIDPTSFLCECG